MSTEVKSKSETINFIFLNSSQRRKYLVKYEYSASKLYQIISYRFVRWDSISCEPHTSRNRTGIRPLRTSESQSRVVTYYRVQWDRETCQDLYLQIERSSSSGGSRAQSIAPSKIATSIGFVSLRLDFTIEVEKLMVGW